MSLPVNRGFKFGDVIGAALTFATKGDTLPMHTHGAADVHFTIITRGEFSCTGPSFEPMTLRPGMIVDWEPGVYHEFVALADNSALTQIQKNLKLTSG